MSRELSPPRERKEKAVTCELLVITTPFSAPALSQTHRWIPTLSDLPNRCNRQTPITSKLPNLTLDFNNFDRERQRKGSLLEEEEEGGGMFYGSVVWDPWLILAQIVTLQCLYYLTLGFLVAVLVGTRVSRVTLVYFFDFATLSPSSLTGWSVISSSFLASLAGAGYVFYLVERAKKCLDFSATLYIVHLLICTVYGGWPSSVTWWVVNGAGLAIMALLGEYLCIRRELREIPITRFRSNV